MLLIWEIGLVIFFVGLIGAEDIIKADLQMSNPELYEWYINASRLSIFIVYIVTSALWPIGVILFILTLFNP